MARARDRRAQRRTTLGLRNTRRAHDIDEGMKRVAHRLFFESDGRLSVEQLAMQRPERLHAWIARVDPNLGGPRCTSALGATIRSASLVLA